MRPLVVDAPTAALAGSGPRPVVPVAPAGRRLAGADAAFAAIEEAGPTAVVLARPAGSAPGAEHLGALARLLRVPCVRVPADVNAAAWVLAAACHPEFGDDDLVRRLEVLAGVAVAGGTGLPALRPRVLARWAGCVWRPCGRCSAGGGLRGAACGRCGASAMGVAA